MKYQRPTERRNGFKQFAVGTHAATITKVQNKQAKSGSDMFILFLEGKNEEQGRFSLTFGNDFTQDNMNFLLASIEDNGVEIPDLTFGYNPDTLKFLTRKDVYIRVEEGSYQGQPQVQIKEFLTLEEFENSEEESGFDGFGQEDNFHSSEWQ
ncbi:type III secretion system protein PrgE [Enterococcus plantarum]|uniref:type III secretion system protein PrgE n=1 Tax=Enterococcus plantarum TaxID=1077675 RepID=UPI00084DF00F|nr:type III secretion system protein PrgE [Enterococcus plantarum]OEG18024.1 type III secretion system protein PrgE [Enterococcus plantarum]